VSESLSRQAMFDRAVIGLRSQGYERSVDAVGTCLYASHGNERRCAWGWVDRDLTPDHNFGTVSSLRSNNIGIAAKLDQADLDFANALQRCHDFASSPSEMRAMLRAFAIMFMLLWPTSDGELPVVHDRVAFEVDLP
jgi:hypothetical protein